MEIPLQTYPEGTYVRYVHWRTRESRGRYGVVVQVEEEHVDHYGRLSRAHAVFLVPDADNEDEYDAVEDRLDDDELEPFEPSEGELQRILLARLEA